MGSRILTATLLALTGLLVVAAESPSDGSAAGGAQDPDEWARLAAHRHQAGDYAGAIEANRRAAESPLFRAGALYNTACAHALLGDVEAAATALHEALEAGFLDYDLMKTDPDIEALRKEGRVDFPPERAYEKLRARNGVELRYLVELPDPHDRSRAYPALVAFPPGGWGAASTDWALSEVWGGSTAKEGWIAVHVVAPADGWLNHPAHHALEELLDEILREHRIEGGAFHLVGVASGARPASTYASMSRKYFQSFTAVSNYAFDRWDEDELIQFPQKRVHLLVGAEDAHGADAARRASAVLGEDHVSIRTYPGKGRIPASLRRGALTQYLATNVRKAPDAG